MARKSTGRIQQTRDWFSKTMDRRASAQLRNSVTIVDHDELHRMNRMPLTYSDNRVLISDDAAYAASKIPMQSWAFLDHTTKQSNWRNATTFFGQVFPHEPGNAGHLIVTNRVYSAEAWHANIIERTEEAKRNPANRINERTIRYLHAYLDASKAAVFDDEHGDQFFERAVYLVTKIGHRTDGQKFTQMLLKALEDIIIMAAGDKEPPEPAEIAAWVDKANMVASSLSQASLRATPISQWEVEWLMRHLDTPGMPTPALAYTASDGDLDADPEWVLRGRQDQINRGLDPDHPEKGRQDDNPLKRVAPESAVERWGFGQWKTTLASYTKVVSLGRGANKEDLHAVLFQTPTADEQGNNEVYSCYLALNHIPGTVFYNLNWLHESSKLGFAVDASVHFQVLDQSATEKEITKRIRSAENQAMDDQEAGVAGDETNKENHAQLEGLKTQQRRNKKPLVFWQCILNVYDTDKDRLRDRVNALINHYKQSLQMELVCPADDQRELFYQSLPGSEVLVDDWWQQTAPEYLASSAPWLTESIGDNRGLYQGYTYTEAGNKGNPFFYDNFTAVDIAGKAPTECVTGNPGAGKTVSRGLKVVYEDALQGDVTQFVMDPKGDFRPLYDNAFMLGLDDRVRLIDLGDPASSVSLDPFGVAEYEIDEETGDLHDERSSLARRVVQQLLSYGSEDPLRIEVAELAVKRVLRAEQLENKQPSMKELLQTLYRWGQASFDEIDTKETEDELPLIPQTEAESAKLVDGARRAHRQLLEYSKTRLGKPLFKPYGTSTAMKISPGTLTIFIGLHLKFEEEGERESEENLISKVIMSLMTDYIRSLLSDKTIAKSKKSATFDEWHVIKKMGGAEGLMTWMRRMGRSRRCAVRQLSQSAGDFDTNSLTTAWCGWVENETEAKLSCRLLGIEESAANIRLLMSLQRGQFIFRDHRGRVAWVQVDFWDPNQLELFNTQAADLERKELQNAAT